MIKTKLSPQEIKHIAILAKLEPNQGEEIALGKQVEITVEYISELSEVDTANVPITTQVTGLTNIFREDLIDKKRVLTQNQALFNAKRAHNGYFVVNAIFED